MQPAQISHFPDLVQHPAEIEGTKQKIHQVQAKGNTQFAHISYSGCQYLAHALKDISRRQKVGNFLQPDRQDGNRVKNG